MTDKTAKANVEPVRQRTQYSCMAASMAMCLRAVGHDVTEDEVNRVMGARPMKGAAWEQALATAQHYGCRATLTMPATVEQLKEWTDAGVPVMIAWNPEGRPWSHASVVFDVDDKLNVYVADPNIPNPKKTVRTVSEDEFYGKWYEKFPDYLVRRPACAIAREVTTTGKQIAPTRVASVQKTASTGDTDYYFAIVGKGRDAFWQMEQKLPALLRKLRWSNFEVHDENRSYRDEMDTTSTSYYFVVLGKGSKPYWEMSQDLEQALKRAGWTTVEVHDENRKYRHASEGAARGTTDHGDGTFSGNWSGYVVRLQDGSELTTDTGNRCMSPGCKVSVTIQGGNFTVFHARDKMASDKTGKRRGKGRGSQPTTRTEQEKRKDKNRVTGPAPKRRLGPEFTEQVARRPGAGRHKNKGQRGQGTKGKGKGQRHPKHKRQWAASCERLETRMAVERVATRVAARANYAEWQKKIPGSEVVGSPEQKALSAFWDFCQGELVEAVHLTDALEMVAWDMGYQGRSLRFAPGLEFLAKKLRMNLRKDWEDGKRGKEAAYSGNPDGKPIYDVKVDHGEEQALSGGHDIMKRLQDRYLIEQGKAPREKNPRLAAADIKSLAQKVSQGLSRAKRNLAKQYPDDGTDIEHYVGNVASAVGMLTRFPEPIIGDWKRMGLKADDVLFEESVSRELTDRIIDGARIRREFNALYKELAGHLGGSARLAAQEPAKADQVAKALARITQIQAVKRIPHPNRRTDFGEGLDVSFKDPKGALGYSIKLFPTQWGWATDPHNFMLGFDAKSVVKQILWHLQPRYNVYEAGDAILLVRNDTDQGAVERVLRGRIRQVGSNLLWKEVGKWIGNRIEVDVTDKIPGDAMAYLPRDWDASGGYMTDDGMVEESVYNIPEMLQKRYAAARLDSKTRRAANAALIRAGLDGNGRFRKPEHAYSKAIDVLQGFGMELDTVVSSHLFQQRPSGTLTIDMAFTNEADRFSPESISNSVLYLQFTELQPNRFEAVAYLS